MPRARSPLGWGRLAGVAGLIFGTGLLLGAGRVVLAFAPQALHAFRRRLFGASSRSALALLEVDLRVSGPLPSPPFLLVANHLSYLDVVVLASLLPCCFIAKAEVCEWPVLGPICRGFGTIFIDRDDLRDIPRAVASMEEALARGMGVVFFPEGTSSPGGAVLPFRSPLLAPAARSGKPVHFAALGYRTRPGDPPAQTAVCWWGEMSLFPHLVGLTRLRGIEAKVCFGEEPLAETDRKQLARKLRAAILEKLGLYGASE